MKRFAALAFLLVVLAPVASAKGPAPLYGVEWRLGGGVTLLRFDATTLAPLKGLRLNLGSATSPIARSPDGRRLAAAGQSMIRIADLRTQKVSPPLYVGGYPVRDGTLWVKLNRLIVEVDGELVVIDPRGRANELRRIDLKADVLHAVNNCNRLVLLLAPRDAVGQLSIAVVDADGNVRSARIDGMRGGQRPLKDADGNPIGMHLETPAFAVEPSGKRAVVAGRTSVALVALADLSSQTHALQVRSTQKQIDGWTRNAAWLDASHVAVFGSDWNGDHTGTTLPVQILDLGAWTSQTLDVKVPYAISMGSLLVTADDAISAYEPDGRLRFRAVEGRTAGQLSAGDTWIYAETTGHGTHYVVLDPRSGRVVASRTFARPTNIVTGL